MSASSLASVRAEFIRLWGRLGPFWGVTPTAARIYAALLCAPGSRAAEELVSDLALSRGAVSMACRELLEWGLIHAERPVGSRRLAYRIEPDAEQVIRRIVGTRKRREWDPMLERLRSWREQLAGERSREAVLLRARLGEIEALVSSIDELASLFLRGGSLPRLGLKALTAVARRSTRRLR